MATKREGPPAPAGDVHAAERALARKLRRVGDDLAREEEAAEPRARGTETRYAKSGDLSIAYQVVGNGPDVVFVAGSVSHVELGWEAPPTAPVHRRLSRFGRMVTFDKRGVGLSDRSTNLPTLEQRMDDVRCDGNGVRQFLAVQRDQYVDVMDLEPYDAIFAVIAERDIRYPDERAKFPWEKQLGNNAGQNRLQF
jgi:hypothetical protein